jgi:hypothetical protein
VTCTIGNNFRMVHFFIEGLYFFIHTPYSQAYLICVAVPAVLAAASAVDYVTSSCRYAVTPPWLLPSCLGKIYTTMLVRAHR